jgi:hypothetical protein
VFRSLFLPPTLNSAGRRTAGPLYTSGAEITDNHADDAHEYKCINGSERPNKEQQMILRHGEP